MTREHLIDAIYNDPNRWSCIEYSCDETEDGNAEDCCRRCAEKQLAEYEKKIRNDAIDEFAKEVCKLYTEFQRNGFYADTNNMVKQRICDIAEQLKGETE